VVQLSIITGETGERVDFSTLRQAVGGHIFIVAFFTAEEELFPPERNGVGLTFGDIALADGVLHQLFRRLFRLGHLSFGGKESALDHPIDHRENNEVYD
jgi:hypothetical protein